MWPRNEQLMFCNPQCRELFRIFTDYSWVVHGSVRGSVHGIVRGSVHGIAHGCSWIVPGCSRIILELFSMFSNCCEKVLTNTEVYDSLIKVVQTMPKTVGAKILKIIA